MKPRGFQRLRHLAAVLAAALVAAVFVPIPAANAILQPGLVGLSRAAAVEGIVMLENDNEALPFTADKTVSVFGRVQINYFNVGYGSGGDVKYPYSTNLLTGLRRNPAINVNEQLASVYETWTANNVPSDGSWGNWPTNYPEMPLDNSVVTDAADNSDVALVVIGRSAGEDRESTDTPGSYQLTPAEIDMLDKVDTAFDQVVVLLNTGNLIDLSWLDDYDNIDALVYAWQGGMEAGSAVADVLSGDESPSGKLTQTIAETLADYPTFENFGNWATTDYEEDIFVGYRYFETFAKDKVLYPFGYGLSYTDFNVTTNSITFDGGKVNVDVTVENTGDRAGKEVVQVYYGAPQGQLGKAAKSLAAYAKTGLLQPGATEDITISYKIDDMASYDDGNYTGDYGTDGAWVLEAGDYPIYVGTDVRSSAVQGTYTEPTLRVVEQLEQVLRPRDDLIRWHASDDGAGGVELDTEQIVPKQTIDLKERIEADIATDSPNLPYNQGDQGIDLIDVYNGDNTLDEFIAQMNLDDLANLTRGAGAMGHGFGIPGNASVYGGTNTKLRDTFGIPAMSTTDGPSGIRMTAEATLLPIGTALASTWNDRLVEELYSLLAKEMLLNGSDTLLAPGMNLQRDPRLGRNFEYFSEDPLLTGQMGAATVMGIQKEGVAATPKHYAANNQETNRHVNDSRASERALREVYLRAFEIMVKTSDPQNIMMGYHRVNKSWTWANYDLSTTVLRKQWGWDGLTITDWWIHFGNAADWGGGAKKCADIDLKGPALEWNQCRIRGGVDVLMPGDNEQQGPPQTGVTNGSLDIGEIQRSAKRTLEFAMKSSKFRNDHDLPLYDYEAGAPWFDVDQPEESARPRLTGLFVDGVEVPGFSPLTSEYLIYAKDASSFPVVTATADEELTVDITQATAETSTATVTVSSDTMVTRYRIIWSNDPDLPLPEGAQRARITSVDINGEPFLPFYQDIYHYSVPEVEPDQIEFTGWSAPDGVDVEVLGPDANGRFIVRADTADHRRDYIFDFGRSTFVQPQSDDFAGTTLSDFWTVENETSNLTKPNGSLQIVTEDGDWWEGQSGMHNNVWQRADGDWTAVTEIDYSVRPHQNYHQFGVAVYDDENNFLQFQLEYNNWDGNVAQPFQWVVKNETNGSNAANGVNAAPDITSTGPGKIYLRVTKVGNQYTFARSLDGVTFTNVGSPVTKAFSQPKFAVQAFHSALGNTTDHIGGAPIEPITVNFQDVTFDVEEPTPGTLPTAPVTTIAASGTTRVKAANDHFYMTSGLGTENCQAPCSGQNLGWATPGAYALYNIDVATPGIYSVIPNVASDASGASQLSMSLVVNGERAATFNRAGGTGGWQSWQRMGAEQMYLEAGLNKLQIYFNTGDWNVDYLEFERQVVDSSTLEAVLVQAAALKQSDYTATSWAALQAAVSAAQAVLDDPRSTDSDIEDAVQVVLTAISDLVPAGLADLGAAIAQADGLKKSDYSAASWAALQTALANARAVANSPGATQAQIVAATAAVLDAIAALVPAGSGTTPPPPAKVSVTGVRVAQKQVTLIAKKSIKVPAVVDFSDGSTKGVKAVKFTSNQPSVVRVNKKGKIKAVRAGKAKIVVRSKARLANGKRAKAVIKVRVLAKKANGKQSKIGKVKVKAPKNLKVGATADLRVNYKQRKAAGVKVTFKSSAKKVLRVDKAGRVTARQPGKAKIRVKVGKRTATVTIRVRA